MRVSVSARREALNIRIQPHVRALIDRAGELAGKNRTDFVLDAARRAAEDTLLDRTTFAVGPKAYREFLARDDHQIEGFASGEPVLDDWLTRRARANQASGASRTYVVCEDMRVVGYYALAFGAIAQATVPGKFRRNMPDPIPVVVLARMTVDRSRQGHGLGRAMFRDAARRVAHAADTIGIRGIVVHAISEDARKFYIAVGLDPLPPGVVCRLESRRRP